MDFDTSSFHFFIFISSFHFSFLISHLSFYHLSHLSLLIQASMNFLAALSWCLITLRNS